jgi:hypothetical protein
MAMFLVVVLRSGPEWQPSLSLEEQSGWVEHASFMDGLVDTRTACPCLAFTAALRGRGASARTALARRWPA